MAGKTPMMKRTALFFEPTAMQKLKMLSDVTGAPVAELIRRATDTYLEKRQPEIAAWGKKQ